MRVKLLSLLQHPPLVHSTAFPSGRDGNIVSGRGSGYPRRRLNVPHWSGVACFFSQDIHLRQPSPSLRLVAKVSKYLPSPLSFIAFQ